MKLKPNNKVPDLKDIHVTQAVDTYIHLGHTQAALAIKPEKRSAFFARHKEVETLLLREEENPLLEEGRITDDERDHSGEYYLTYEALTLLVEKKIRRHNTVRGQSYNVKNLFVLKNDISQLQSVLINLNLMSGDDAKLIYISGVHAVPFYLHNEKGQIKCFIVDSEAGVYENPDDIINVVKSVFPSAKIYLNNTTLQKDFYSCATFAFKAMRYFAKHGSEVFPWLEKNSGQEDEYYILPPERLMPSLLKMNQSKLVLSDELLDSVVSHKGKVTLREYYKRSVVVAEGKSFNSSALLKKYKYLFELNDYIVNNLGQEQLVPFPFSFDRMRCTI